MQPFTGKRQNMHLTVTISVLTGYSNTTVLVGYSETPDCEQDLTSQGAGLKYRQFPATFSLNLPGRGKPNPDL
jgi:hypothetical protein